MHILTTYELSYTRKGVTLTKLLRSTWLLIKYTKDLV